MFLKLLILTVILVAFLMLALGVKMLFNPDAEFSAHSCSADEGQQGSEKGCSACEIKDLVDCSESKTEIS